MDIHATQSVGRRVVVRTPENIELTYELAGAGTRAAAYIIDLLVLAAVAVFAQNLVLALGMLAGPDGLPYAIAIFGIIWFAILNAYFIVCEAFWNGQTPGKRAVGIRVVKTGGYALRLTDCIVRNLMRAIDFLPMMYAIGIGSLLLTRNCQRLGDLVAGALVVYQDAEEPGGAIPVIDGVVALELNSLQVDAVPAEILEACDEFLRSANDMNSKYRQAYADKLLQLVEAHSGLVCPVTASAERFLATVIRQRERSHSSS